MSLQDLTVYQLRTLAQRAGIKDSHYMRKPELMALLYRMGVCPEKRQNGQKEQKGGVSAWMNNWYARTVVEGNRALSEYTEERIENSPMFNPLSMETEIPTPSSGIIPEGLWLAGRRPDLSSELD